MNKLRTGVIIAKAEKKFNQKVELLKKRMYQDVSAPSGSFPQVGVRTGKLRASLHKRKLDSGNLRLGFKAKYAKWAINYKGKNPRGLIKSWYNYWKSLF